jgi:hypothetical protein
VDGKDTTCFIHSRGQQRRKLPPVVQPDTSDWPSAAATTALPTSACFITPNCTRPAPRHVKSCLGRSAPRRAHRCLTLVRVESTACRAHVSCLCSWNPGDGRVRAFHVCAPTWPRQFADHSMRDIGLGPSTPWLWPRHPARLVLQASVSAIAARLSSWPNYSRKSPCQGLDWKNWFRASRQRDTKAVVNSLVVQCGGRSSAEKKYTWQKHVPLCVNKLGTECCLAE